MKFDVQVDRDHCKGCGLCVAFCPRECLTMARTVNARGYHYAEFAVPRQCTGCLQCARVCPDTAIEVYRLESRSPVAAETGVRGG